MFQSTDQMHNFSRLFGAKGVSLLFIFLTFIEDPVVGSLTALECAMDGFHKLSQMAEEVFGEDVFSSGKTKNKQKENVTGR